MVGTVALQTLAVRTVEHTRLAEWLQCHRVEFGDVEQAVAVDDIHTSIIVNQEAWVVEYVMVIPVVTILLL